MTKWSGLAPAVDAHLKRWAEAKDNEHLVKLAYEIPDTGDTEALARTVLASPWIYTWIKFGLSYGLPDEQGIPRIAVEMREDAMTVKEAITAPVSDGQTTGFIGDEPKVVTIEGQTIAGREQFSGGAAGFMQGVNLAERELKMLRAATTHYVSAEVVAEVTLAAELAEPEPLFGTDLFCPAGFAVFEAPVHMPDLDPDTGLPDPRLTVYLRAMGWQAHGGIMNMKSGKTLEGVTIFFYTTKEDFRDGYLASLNASGREAQFSWEDVAEGFVPVEVLPWAFGVDWSVREQVGYVPGTVPSPVGAERRWFLAFMRLCWQEVIVHHRESFKRADYRRWDRMAKAKELLDYTTLRLRRHVDPNPQRESGTGIPLEHRVLVRAHWRRQYLPSMGPARLPDGTMNPESHRLCWIERHWRGPEDGPIGAMHSATSVVQ
jgi:hypothetical protein